MKGMSEGMCRQSILLMVVSADPRREAAMPVHVTNGPVSRDVVPLLLLDMKYRHTGIPKRGRYVSVCDGRVTDQSRSSSMYDPRTGSELVFTDGPRPIQRQSERSLVWMNDA